METVAEIEAEAFTTPWKVETFRALLKRDNVVTLVLEGEGIVVGYAVLWCVLEQGELANLAIREPCRGRGLSRILLDAVIEQARVRGVHRLYLEVRASNEPAAALYAGHGFEEIGRRPDYYDRPKEDARVLVRHL